MSHSNEGPTPRRSLPVVQEPGPAPGSRDGIEPAPEMDRRQALKVMAIAAAVPALANCGPGEAPTGGASVGDAPTPTSNPKAAGTAWDPDLVAPSVPWERVLAQGELATLAVLCDLILPADEGSPAASALGAHDFVDEWVSAPYDWNRSDLVLIRGGLAWLDHESARRFGVGSRFAALDAGQQAAICDDICYAPDALPEHATAARFFDRVRDLTSTAVWTTDEGMRDLGYVGNVALPRWDPPPPEVLRHLGLDVEA